MCFIVLIVNTPTQYRLIIITVTSDYDGKGYKCNINKQILKDTFHKLTKLKRQMKKIIFIFFIALTSHINAQNETIFFRAFEKADATTLNNYMANSVEFCLLDDQNLVKGNAVPAKIQSFISTYNIQRVEIMHNGTSKDKSSQYFVAKAISTKGDFRVFVYAKGSLGPNSVKEIRIDKF